MSILFIRYNKAHLIVVAVVSVPATKRSAKIVNSCPAVNIKVVIYNYTMDISRVVLTNMYERFILLVFSFVFRRIVYHVLPVSLDCQFVIVPSAFSNVDLPLRCTQCLSIFLLDLISYCITFKYII